jgi:tRNA G37 N-methylase Trm5
VNKLDTIDNQFRFFKMELIAGEPNYVVEHVRNSFLFAFCSNSIFSMSRIVVSLLTFPKYIGIQGCILNTTD